MKGLSPEWDDYIELRCCLGWELKLFVQVTYQNGKIETLEVDNLIVGTCTTGGYYIRQVEYALSSSYPSRQLTNDSSVERSLYQLISFQIIKVYVSSSSIVVQKNPNHFLLPHLLLESMVSQGSYSLSCKR